MKIAIVTNKVHSVGGVQNSSKLLSKIFKERGHETTIIGEESLPVKAQKDLEIAVGEYFNQKNKSENFDVVLCNGECGYSVEHPKAVNVFRGNYYGYAMAVRDLVEHEVTEERLQKVNMQKISAEGKYIVTISEFAVKGLNDSGIKVDKIIRNCIDMDIFYQINTEISDSAIASSRGMWYEKGFDILEKLAGKGIKTKLFSDLIIDSPNILNMGFFANGDLCEEYNKAQIFLNPTRFEGGGLTTLEAMACGCPVLTTPTGYGFDIKDCIPNFVAEPDNINEFLEKHVLITNERERYSKQALDYFWTFHNPEKFKREWIDLIENI
ncbi:glycosyltransferase family 4 protein [Candidatus Pacearchaeota archaeon]|nr:glycosyltransferase family 4 protein [Candidatus Pacearchaeota archaeon]